MVNYKITKMKHKKLFLMAALFFTLSGSAQESEWGIKAGVNLSNFYSDEVDDQNMRVGYHGGVYFKAHLLDFLAIQPEIMYVTRGSTTKYNSPFLGSYEFSQELNYIEIPVLAVLNITKKLNVHAGPYAAVLLNAQLENETENSFFDFVKEIDDADFKRIDYGFAAGIGLEFDFLRFGARYNVGLQEIGDAEDGSVVGFANNINNSKNAAISFYVGLSF